MNKDIFSESKRLSYIADSARKVFKRWNYKEIYLPSVVRYNSSLRKGLKITYNNEFYTVRPDPTSQISANFNNEVPLRKYYVREVLDQNKGTIQVGIEFITDKSLKSKLETLNILISLLEELDIEEFYVDIGSLKVWKEAIEDISSYEDEIFKALKRRNLSLIDDLNIKETKKDDLWNLLNTRGKRSGYKRIDELIEIIDDDRFYADLGTVRPLSYYDDIIFEIYSPKIGFPIGAGGEYKLGSRFGCGFALDLDLLSKVSEKERENKKVTIDGDLRTSYRRARELVKEGKNVEVKI